MLVNLRDICAIAEQNNMAIGQFNAPSFEAVRAVIDAAEQTGYPVILAHAEGHESMMPLDAIGPAMVALAERSSAPICVHLDHCEHLSYMYRALEMGFNGCMFDGSMLPYEENVENSSRAADMCAGYGAGLECELGSMGSRESGERPEGGTAEEAGAVYTDPDQARDFVTETGLDILACSFGTVHGLYKCEPHMAIDAGSRKVNYFTYGAKFAGEAAVAAVDAIRAKGPEEVVYWQDLTIPAYERLVEDFISVIKTFANGAAPLA